MFPAGSPGAAETGRTTANRSGTTSASAQAYPRRREAEETTPRRRAPVRLPEKTPQRAWLGEVSAVVLQQALADLNTAYRNFFASVTGKRKGMSSTNL